MTAAPEPSLRISDHALLRILQRLGGVDVEGLRSSVAQELSGSFSKAQSVGEKDYVIVSQGFAYVVADNTLVTVKPAPKR
ncbi:hypothetical protein [Rhodopseudomonas sp.]|uniref:hypothetical protein n=1 Tax=Rhodopseudomonas sp. TaxID=1078 RepID=UPI003B3B77EA